MKTILILVGIVFFIAMVVFLWLLIAGADESRRKKSNQDSHNDRRDR